MLPKSSFYFILDFQPEHQARNLAANTLTQVLAKKGLA